MNDVILVPNLSDIIPLMGDSTNRMVWNGNTMSPAIEAE